MPTTDPRTAVANAIVTWAAALSGIAAARQGFPEHNQDFDLSAGAIITWEPVGELEREDCNPRAYETTDNGDGTLAALYRVGRFVERGRLDLWCPYKAQRDAAVVTVEEALEPDLPRPGLRLTASDYHDRLLTLFVTSGPRYEDETGDAAVRGEWRASWSVEVRFDRVLEREHVKHVRTDVELDEDAGNPDGSVRTIQIDLSGS